MTQFIAHVGPHKTGTTYLQHCFAQFRPQLAARGICFPATWGQTAHYALQEGLLTVPNPKLEADFSALHAARHDMVLISVEGLAGLPEASIAYLAALVGAANPVRCVYYVRSWADILPSLWKESVKGGETATLPQYLHGRLHNAKGSTFINFSGGLSRWARHFGADSVSLVAYDQLVAQKRDLFAHFAQQFLAWATPPTPEVVAANVSPGAADIEMMRAVAGLERISAGHELSRGHGGAFAQRFMQRKQDIATPTLVAALEAHTTRAVINEMTLPLATLHRELMAEFGAALVPPRLPRFFFRPRRVQVPYIHPDWLLAPGVIEDLRAVHQTLRADVAASGRGHHVR